MRRTLILMGALAALGAFAAAPPAGQAAGFGPVRSLSPAAGSVDSQDVAVGPSSETVVMWRRFGPRVRDFQYVARVGRDPEHLGRPQVVRAGSRAAAAAIGPTLLARPEGGFVACFDNATPRRATVLGCAFTGANGRFGPLRVVERRTLRDDPYFRVSMRTDGKVAVVLSHRIGGGRKQLRSTTLDARGALGPLRRLATVSREAQFSLATTDDGVTAVALSTPQPRDRDGNWDLSLRLTAPGQDVFGAPQKFLEDGVVQSGRGVRLEGGRELRMFVVDDADHLAGPVIVRRLPDGSFSAPLRLPRPAPGVLWGTVVLLADGSPLAISGASRERETDCANVSAGVIGSGALVAAGQNQPPASVQRLSKPGQIALNPTGATLADGTVIASWQNAVHDIAVNRQEVAIRPPGALEFQPSQVLPQLAARDTTLAAGGDRAVLSWVVGNVLDGPSHVVMSSLRKSPPYAAPARLSKRPRTPCG